MVKGHALFNLPAWACKGKDPQDDLFRRSSQTYALDTHIKTNSNRNKERLGQNIYDLGSSPDENKTQELTCSDSSSNEDTVPGRHLLLDNQTACEQDVQSEPTAQCVDGKTSTKSHNNTLGSLQRFLQTPDEASASKATIVASQISSEFEVNAPENLNGMPLIPDKVTSGVDISTTQRNSGPISRSAERCEEVHDEFPELARRAREKSKKRAIEQALGDSEIEASVSMSARSRRIKQASISPHLDPVIEILISSPLPKTLPLIVARRLSQSLKEARLAWAKHQGISDAVSDTIFLVWRGKRLFDYTTCMSLGLAAGSDGTVSSKDEKYGPGPGRLHMEAFNSKLFALMRQSQSQLQTFQATPTNHQQLTAPESVAQTKEQQIRVVLSSKQLPDFKLIVKSSTLISKIINAFRTEHEIGVERSITLHFDGENLGLGQRIEDFELSDMDHVDVYIK